MEMLCLIGIVIVVLGFALKLDSILTIMLSAIVTALVAGLGVNGLLTTIGESFVNNRSMSIFVIVMLVTGTLERNGLKQAAANLIGKIKGASAGVVLSAYALMRGMFGSFNVSFGGVAGFVSPIIMPMATAAAEKKVEKPSEEYIEELKGMSAAVENIIWFFTQCLFIGGAGSLLVKSTLAELGYEVELIDLAIAEIPVAIFAIIITIIFFNLKDKKIRDKELKRKEKI